MDLKQKIALAVGITIAAVSLEYGLYHAVDGYRERKMQEEQQKVIDNLSQNPLLYLTKTPEEFKELYQKEKESFTRASYAKSTSPSDVFPKPEYVSPHVDQTGQTTYEDFKSMDRWFNEHEKCWGVWVKKGECR